MCKKPFKGEVSPAHIRLEGGQPAAITGHSFAKYWLDDAYHESIGDDWHHSRREIIFAALFLEAYLFEWAQSHLARDLGALLQEFPQDASIPSLRKKWTVLIPKIFKVCALGAPPPTTHTEFERLVNFRDRLIHARSSRLSVSSYIDLRWPDPSAEDLRMLPNGWAFQTTIEIVRILHEYAGTELPNYVSRYMS